MKTRFKHWNWNSLLPIWLGVFVLMLAAMHFHNESGRAKARSICNQTIVEGWCDHGHR